MKTAFASLLVFLIMGCTTPKHRPNILFMFSDDHTTQAISIYGDGRIQTPNLDRLATSGILFENCFCTNAICAPSRAVVLTGQYSHINGVTDNSVAFDGNQQTFPKLLQKAGYRTALIGKWHLKSEPTGFDYWEVLPGQGNYFDPEFIEMGERKTIRGYVTDIITSEALEWLRTYDYDQPFCLMVQHKAPHADWEWPRSLANEFQGDFEIPENFHDTYEGRAAAIASSDLKVGTYQWQLHYRYRFGDYPFTSEEEMYQRFLHDYMRCVRAVDNAVDELLKGIKQLGYFDHTVFIYSADQGFFLGEHGLYDKRFMYEEALRMPLIVNPLGNKEVKWSQGVRLSEMVLNLDFAPTILDMAGVQIPQTMPGKSFLPLLSGKPVEDWRKSMYYRLYEGAYNVSPHEGIRTERYKLIHFEAPTDDWELYDLVSDPHEMINLYHLKEYTPLIDSLKSLLPIPNSQFPNPNSLIPIP